ncbi:MAG: hypothetical protein OXT67_13830 [Zetaproteobacteria bacterium]|nr:hypothetical protein [Zetaproteobacteria bacterium]
MDTSKIKKSGCLLSVVAALNSNTQVLAEAQDIQSKFVSPKQDSYGEYILSQVVGDGKTPVNEWEWSKSHGKEHTKSFSKDR